ncbi:type I restriction endonuclease [Solirubrobacter phytolaccae]|uniref:Type I restriction endonuclease n=1 Tax=Solirubrobacter phytolaccae TaxID=1404360 RepID=A0A9X3S9P7_9ACTN|nr:type I restriction endonuclease [Solirubrobacter phytolaccae]MDA0181716.1 type I restriction endonuclease [Solirubrobacter phytolaccae]
MSAAAHTESAFERLIVRDLVTNGGWFGEDTDGAPTEHKNYDAALGLYPDDLIAFVKETQGKAWDALVGIAGSEQDARTSLLKRVGAQIDKRGTVEVLRAGLSEKGVQLKLAFFEPELEVEKSARVLYDENRPRVVRQVRFDANSGDSLDLVMFVNGVPTATAELKNRYTGQTVDDAIRQYRKDRPPTNLLLGRRAFVHFALDADLAYMTTRLAGTDTRFLPFNQGSGGAGKPGGQGNPPSPSSGHPTDYVWKSVWERDAWMELIEKFVFVEQPDAAAKKKGAKPTVIFPRFHQWDVVRSCAAHARVHGAGQNYLIQHSAGSGKSKEIAWLAHDLSTLHGDDKKPVFEKVIVITDRQVLDRQLQAQVKAFEQVPGTVREINESSTQLREALEGEQARIVISTLQKFPYVLAQLTGTNATLNQRTYAVIVDEAHSSQTGESAVDLKAVLGSRPVDEDDEDDGVPEVLRRLAARGVQPNLSFFAFTATPKPRTNEVFGSVGADGNKHAFHTYSMRQAVEENFIVDVLRNYTTYEELLRIEDRAQREVELPKGKASSALTRYATFHPYRKAQKAVVVLDHYDTIVRQHMAGEAKAMIVTASREEAVQWKLTLDKEIAKRGSATKTLVAFSGEVTITHPAADNVGEQYSEPQMNVVNGHPVPEKKLPDEFDKPAYGVLIVAEKYQTGFDQPKLVAMYVDKTLTGVNTVQTLSRLNRTHPLKTETYVLDFVNDADRIRQDFEPFYGRTEAIPTDPNVLFDAQQQLLDGGVVYEAEVDAFAQAWFVPGEPDHAVLSGLTQSAFDRATDLEDDDLDQLREDLDRFVRFYAFLAQVVPYLTQQSEKLYAFARFLALRLRERRVDGGLSLDVSLTHYRLTEVGTQNLTLGDDEVEPGTAISGDGTGHGAGGEIPMSLLGELVELFNHRFGEHLTDADAIHPAQALIDHIDREQSDTLRRQAASNDFDDFVRGKEPFVIDGALDAGKVSADFFRGVLDDEDFRQRTTFLAMRVLYDRYRSDQAAGT